MCPRSANSCRATRAAAGSAIGAPKDTPADIVDTLNKAINAGLADEKFKARLNDLGVIVNPMSAAEFAKYIVAETAKWGKVVKFAHITAE